MRLITERDLIREAIKVYIGKFGAKLDPETATAKEVNEWLGGSSWTIIQCNECREVVETVVEVGEEPYHGSLTARLCFTCIGKAAIMCNN